MANKARGERGLKIGTKTYPLALTLGALAELEDILGVTTLNGLEEALNNVRPSQLPKIIHALAGGNAAGLELDHVCGVHVSDAMAAIQGVFAGDGEPGKPTQT